MTRRLFSFLPLVCLALSACQHRVAVPLYFESIDQMDAWLQRNAFVRAAATSLPGDRQVEPSLPLVERVVENDRSAVQSGAMDAEARR